MPDPIKPIKRSEQLAPLSRDHHEGLLFVWKIRTGLKNGTSVNEMTDYSRWFWQNHLENHFRREEKILAPRVPAGNIHLLKMFKEHLDICELIGSEYLADAFKLESLATAINDHIRFEERVFFPEIEKLISKEQLQQIYEALTREEKDCPSWPNSFWLKNSI